MAEPWQYCAHCKRHFKTIEEFNSHFDRDWVLEDWETTKIVVKMRENA